MRLLADFQPRLVGPVLTGTATPHTDISLHLFAETPETVTLRLADRGIPSENGRPVEGFRDTYFGDDSNRSLFDANCPEFLRNTLYLQMLRDTPVVYGDEQRTKQEHVFTYQIFANCLQESTRLGAEYLMADLSGIIELHREHYRKGVLNNLFFTTLHLREYHYQKQKNNAFYHIQAINLPFQNFEFNYLP